MNLKGYQPLAMRTAKFMDASDMLVHGAMGVASEAGEFAETAVMFILGGEFNRKHAVEELGDGCWFAAYCAQTIGVELHHVVFEREGTPAVGGKDDYVTHPKDVAVAALRYCAWGAELCTQIKAVQFYGKALDTEKFLNALHEYMSAIYWLCAVFHIPIDEVLVANIEKLKKRYGDKYTDVAAIARADKSDEDKEAERQELVEKYAPLPVADKVTEAPRNIADPTGELHLHPVCHDTAVSVALAGRTQTQADEELFRKGTEPGSAYTGQD